MANYSNKNATYSGSDNKINSLSIAVPASIIGGIVLIIYFMLLKFGSYHLNTNLRWFNYLLLVPGVFYTLNRYVVAASGKTYLQAFLVSFISILGSIFILAIFMTIYLYIDHPFMEQVYQSAFPELQLTPMSVFLLLIGEGVIGGLILSFVVLQFFKDRIHNAA